MTNGEGVHLTHQGLIAPLLISTIIVGIAQTGDLKAVGRMGGKALLYFKVVTTIALFLGLAVANVLRPHTDLAAQKQASGWELLLHLFPSNLVKHIAEGDILPVVVFSALFGIALTRIGKRGEPLLAFFENGAQVMFKCTDMVMRLTPLGVFGAMAYNVSHMAAGHMVDGVMMHGWPAVFFLLKQYARLVGSLCLALLLMFCFVFVPIMWITGVKVWRFLKMVREPALTAFTTASSEAALPRLLEVLVEFGVPRRVASFVVPAGCLQSRRLHALPCARGPHHRAGGENRDVAHAADRHGAHVHAGIEGRGRGSARDPHRHRRHMHELRPARPGGRGDAARGG